MSSATQPLDGYQRRLFAFLGVASFFEGYDFFALTQILPHLRTQWDLSRTHASYLLGFINIGTVLAYLLVDKADRWGRKRVLTVTIIGYTVFTALSGLSPNVWVFGIAQLCARVFLIAEWATSMVIAAEEYPAERRGMVIGVISASAGLGSAVSVALTPVLSATPLGWRAVYFVGVIPLVIVMFARRGLRETRRFEAQTEVRKDFMAIWRSPYRRRVIEMAAIWFLTYIATQNAVSVWKDYAMNELGWVETRAASAMKLAAVIALPLVFFAGKLLDVVGRRIGAVVILGATALGVAGAYTVTSQGLLTLSLIFTVVGINSSLTVLNALTAELFPTSLRGNAFAWTNNILGRIGYWGSPFVIGIFVEGRGWGPVLRVTAIFPLLALVLVLWLLPETKSKELEETARV